MAQIGFDRVVGQMSVLRLCHRTALRPAGSGLDHQKNWPRHWLRLLGFAALLSASASSALAENIVGRTMVNGALVELIDDGTWRLAGETDSREACQFLYRGVFFCGETFGWRRESYASRTADAIFRSPDGDYWTNFNVLDGGSEDGLTAEGRVLAVLDWFQNDPNVEYVSDRTFQHLGYPAVTITFLWENLGVEYTVLQTNIILSDRLVYAESYGVGYDPDELFLQTHTSFVENISFEALP
jgi:hypothetical protein